MKRSPLASLQKRVLMPNGKARRGAIGRIAEALNAPYGTVRKWIHGEWMPGKAALAKIEDLLRAMPRLEPRNPGRPRKVSTRSATKINSCQQSISACQRT